MMTRLTNEYGNSPLHEAVGSTDVGVISEILVADNSVAHFLNKLGESPLYLSVLIGDLNICNLLLAIPLLSPLPQRRENSPIHAAISHRNSGKEHMLHMKV